MQLFLLAASSVCACAPMLAFLGFVWWVDRYDREPVWLIAIAFLWGAVGAIGGAVVGSMALGLVATGLVGAVDGSVSTDLSWVTAAIGPVVVAPLIEEPAKAAILLLVLRNRHFDNMTDGFVYGAAAGLGFAMTENFLYFAQSSHDVVTWGGTVVIRTFYSAVMHATASAIVGASLGWGRFRHPGVLAVSGAVGLAMATLVHGVWNGLLLGEQLVDAGGLLFGADLLLLPLEVGVTLLVFELCVWDEAATIRYELREEAQAGRIPADHPRIVASWFRRLGRAWLPPHVDRDRYVRIATDLAMRKKQRRQLGDRASSFFREDVERLRDQLVSALREPERPRPAR